ncbi:hypothetical protein AgCh_039853 [Apium graveolens]
MNEKKTIDFDNGWEIIEEGITKFKNILEDQTEPQFNSEEYMKLYRSNPPHDYSGQLYDKYREVFEEHINSTVLPSLREKHGGLMLRELVNIWTNYKVMIKWFSRFFRYLDKHFIARRSLPTFNDVALNCFRDLVDQDVKVKVRTAIVSSLVLPSLQEKHGELMLRELVNRWTNYKVMIKWFSHFFLYIDKYFIARRSLPTLNDVALNCFGDLFQVDQDVKVKVRAAIVSSLVLPSLQEKHGELMLRELVNRWTNYKVMIKWFSRFFLYIDKYFIAQRSLPTLNDVALNCFRDLVDQDVKVKVRAAIVSSPINRERGGTDSPSFVKESFRYIN